MDGFFWQRLAYGVMLVWLCLSGQAFALSTDPCSPSIVSTQVARGGGLGDSDAPPPTHGWADVTLPDHGEAYWPGHEGIVWYRIQWTPGCEVAQWRSRPLALAIDSINMAGQVFVNGELLWRDTHLVEPLSRSWNMPRSWTLPASTMRDGLNTILIQVHGVALTSQSLGAVHVGDPLMLRDRQAQASWNHRSMFTIDMMGSFFIACLFLMMWLFYRKAGLYLWFALLNFFWVAFLFNITATETWPFASTADAIRANAIAFMLFCLCFTNFMFQLADRPLKRSLAVMSIVFTGTLILGVLFAPEDHLILMVKIGIRSHLLLFAVTCLALMWIPLRTRKMSDFLYGGMAIVYGAIALHDGRSFFLNLGAVPLTPYANLLTMTGISVILGVRMARSMRRTERFNEELNIAVVNACDELEQSLEKKHELALANTKLQERFELIQDIHDGFGSALVRAITLAETEKEGGAPVPSCCACGLPPSEGALIALGTARQQKNRHVSTLKSLRDDLRLVIDSGRSFSENVPDSPQLWIAQTRYRFSTLFDNIGMRSQWQQPLAWRKSPTAMMCLTLTRFLEEALSNVLKHSQADAVFVTLKYETDQRLVLEIEDNGVGFDVAQAYRDDSGVGLHSMQTRMTRLGGTVEILSAPGKTVVRAVIPLAVSEP